MTERVIANNYVNFIFVFCREGRNSLVHVYMVPGHVIIPFLCGVLELPCTLYVEL